MCPNPLEIADLVTFTEKILDRKFHFLDSGSSKILVVFRDRCSQFFYKIALLKNFTKFTRLIRPHLSFSGIQQINYLSFSYQEIALINQI